MADASSSAKPPVVVWGASYHAKVVADAVRAAGRYEVAGFLDDLNAERAGTAFCGARVLGGRDQLDVLRARGVGHLIMGFGNCRARMELAEIARSKGFELITAVHPRAILAGSARIGAGTLVAAGAVINPDAVVGENVIVNTGAIVEHDCRIEDGAHLCPGVRLAGSVTVGRGTWVGIGSTVIEHIHIGPGTIIGAGAVVVQDVPERVLAVGVPARVTRQLREDEY